MPYVHKDTMTLTLSTAGAATQYSSALNGVVREVFVSISKAVGAGTKVTLTSTDTQKGILTVTNPSTLGAFYYPYKLAQGSTANTLASSTPVEIPLCNERVKVIIASSSSKSGETVTIGIQVI